MLALLSASTRPALLQRLPPSRRSAGLLVNNPVLAQLVRRGQPAGGAYAGGQWQRLGAGAAVGAAGAFVSAAGAFVSAQRGGVSGSNVNRAMIAV